MSRRSAARAQALIALIDQILDLSRMEAGRFDLSPTPVDLPRLVEGVVELLAPRAQSKGLEIAASISAATPRFVRADAMRLRQVLMNLAGNAIKFTERGGVCVSVELVPTGTTLLRFAVTDTGPGVPPERREAIFEDFEQGDGSNARASEGAGLGLAISRRAGRAHGRRADDSRTIRAADRCSPSRYRPARLARTRPRFRRRSRPRSPGVRALIIANSPFEAPAIAMRLAEAGATVARAEGLEPGCGAAGAGTARTSSSSTARSAPRRPTASPRPLGRRARRGACCCFRPSSAARSARPRSGASTAGW